MPWGAELGRFLEDKPIQTPRLGAGTKLRRWCRRQPAVAAALGVVLIGLAGALALAVVRSHKMRRQLDALTQAATQAAPERAAERTQSRLAEWQVYAGRLTSAWQAWQLGKAREAWEYLNTARWDFRLGA